MAVMGRLYWEEWEWGGEEEGLLPDSTPASFRLRSLSGSWDLMWLHKKHSLEKTPSVFEALPLSWVGKQWSLVVLSPGRGKGKYM